MRPSISKKAHSKIPILAGTALVTALTAVAAYAALGQTGGQWVYPFDDAYIHLAMARNAAEHGVWGVTARHFAPATSSPLWTAVLAVVIHLAGWAPLAPIWLNVLLGGLVLWRAERLLKPHALSALARTLLISAGVLILPLPALVLSGMEHTLHILLVLLFAPMAMDYAAHHMPRRSTAFLLMLLAAALVMTRYESLFLLAAAGAILWLKRRRWMAVGVVAAGLVPIALYGAWMVQQRWFFFPPSLLLKGNLPSLASLTGWLKFFNAAWYRIMNSGALMVLAVGAGWAMLGKMGRSWDQWHGRDLLALAFLSTTLLHLVFASTGSFYRYEAYLVALGLASWAAYIPKAAFSISVWRRNHPARAMRVFGVGLIALACVPLMERATYSLRLLPVACGNIARQQIQMARFVHQFYEGRAVALNDIGAVNALADIDCLDLFGLNTREVADSRRTGTFDAQKIDSLARQANVKIAIIYESWFDGLIPPSWKRIGQWRITGRNIACADDTVTLYAVDPAQAGPIERNLVAFGQQLPASVVQSRNCIY